jgi:pimeloyl-ACP methyl ester carboxylesterase
MIRPLSPLLTALALLSAAVPARADPLPAMKSVQVYGQTIRYIEAGQGPDLVLVHGLASSARFDWGKVIPELAKSHHVLAMDQLGFGSSAKPLIAYGVQTWVDMLDGFLRARRVTRFTLAGESLGGWVVALYTIEAETGRKMAVPERLILSDAAGHKSITEHAADAFAEALSLKTERAGLSTIFHDQSLVTDQFVHDDFAVQLAEGSQYTQDSFWKNINDPATFVDERLGAITVPTLVVWGGDDRVIPLEQGRDYAAKIAGAKLVVIPDCGHGPMVERPGEFLKVVGAFLAGR